MTTPAPADPHPVPHAAAEPHHVPHGYAHPRERHHWYWYAGLAAGCLMVALTFVTFSMFDHAASPLCTREVDDTVSAPQGSYDVDVATVSCFGGAPRQRVMMRTDNGAGHTVVSFDGAAHVQARWASESELLVTHKGGKVLTFEPAWHGIRIHYR
jgi:hypothetical protein